MAQAIARRAMKKMMSDSSSKLFGKTFMSNSASSTFGRIHQNQKSTKIISSFSPLTNKNQFPFLHPSATTSRRNYFFLFLQEEHKHPLFPPQKDQNPITSKYLPWLAVPGGILAFIYMVDNFLPPYCRQEPVIDREDQVRYRFRLEKDVRQEDVKFKIVDNSVLELSYMYRDYTKRRIVKKELPKGNYANAEVKGWLDNYDMFSVDITGFQREPTKKQLSGLYQYGWVFFFLHDWLYSFVFWLGAKY